MKINELHKITKLTKKILTSIYVDVSDTATSSI
jgi:hypothetical protein